MLLTIESKQKYKRSIKNTSTNAIKMHKNAIHDDDDDEAKIQKIH